MRVLLIEPQPHIEAWLASELRSEGLEIAASISEANVVVAFVDAPVDGWADVVHPAFMAGVPIVATHLGSAAPELPGDATATLRRPFSIEALRAVIRGLAARGAVTPDPARTATTQPASARETPSSSGGEVTAPVAVPGLSAGRATQTFAASAANLVAVWAEMPLDARTDAIAAFLERYRAASSDNG